MTITKRQIFYLAVASVFLATLGFVANQTRSAMRNHQVRTWVLSYGGIVLYMPVDSTGATVWKQRSPDILTDWFGEPVFDRITHISLSGSPQFSMEEIGTLVRLKSLKSIEMCASSFSDDHAALLARNRSITHLRLRETAVTDAGLATIAQSMRQLEIIELERNSSISINGLTHIGKLPNLRELFLVETPMSDKGLKELRGMRSLEKIYVGKGVTDEGIREIAKLVNLKEVGFLDSDITDEGVDALIAGLPNLERLMLIVPAVSEEKKIEAESAGIEILSPWHH